MSARALCLFGRREINLKQVAQWHPDRISPEDREKPPANHSDDAHPSHGPLSSREPDTMPI